METILILAGIALVAVSIGAIYALTVMVKLKETLESLDTSMKEVAKKSLPVLDNIEVITSKFKHVAETVDDEVINIQQSIRTMRDIAENLVSFERRLQDRVEIPILEAASFFAAIVRGVKIFSEKLRGH